MDRVEQFWQKFLNETAQTETLTCTEAFSFGYGEQMADSLLALVLQGKKTATCCRYIDGDEIAKPGELSIVLDGRGEPCCVIETVDTIILPYHQVDYELAMLEGEDDTLESWQKNHKEFFENEGKRKGFEFDDNMLLCFEKFKVIYKQSIHQRDLSFEVKNPVSKVVNISTLSKDEFYNELEKGYSDWVNGETKSAKQAFSNIRRELDQGTDYKVR